MKEDETSTPFEKEIEEFNAGNALLDLWIDAIEQADKEGAERPTFGGFQSAIERERP